MIEVIPSINCAPGDDAAVARMVREAELFASWAHLDVADGRFTPHISWNDPERWAMLRTPLALEVHLMVEEPERHVEPWLVAGARRIIAHVEAVLPNRYRPHGYAMKETFGRMFADCRARGAELLFALNPETPPERLAPFAPHLHGALVLAVHPGLSGQKFLPLAIEKIRAIRRAFPNLAVELDGGVTPEIAVRARAAGVHAIVSEHYIFGGENPKTAYAALRRAVTP